MRKIHLKSIITSCQRNLNRPIDRLMNTQLEFFKDHITEEAE